jgi:myo-inositol-1(or 4)-monophosphatase
MSGERTEPDRVERSVVEELLDLAVTAARAAGSVLRERFREPRTGVDTKSSSTDMVTDADRAAEAVILSGIRSERPNDAIWGEESGHDDGSTGLRWVVDPLDGTTNFLFGIPHWAVSIACEDADGAVLGVVYDPLRDELFVARRGKGATLNDEPIAVSGATDLEHGLVATGFSYRPEERAAAAAILPALITRIRDVRRAGAAALDLAWVAAGRLDGYYETPIEHWDVAAGALLVREAGGVVGSLPSVGRPRSEGLVAAAPGVFEDLRKAVLDLLEGQG